MIENPLKSKAMNMDYIKCSVALAIGGSSTVRGFDFPAKQLLTWLQFNLGKCDYPNPGTTAYDSNTAYSNMVLSMAAVPVIISPVKYLSHSKLVVVQNALSLIWNGLR